MVESLPRRWRAAAAKAAAAAPGSSAWVIARTTTARRAPRAMTSIEALERFDPADREPRPVVLPGRRHGVIRSSPAAGRPGLVGVVQVGPQQ